MNVLEIRSFLGLVGCYRRFIKHFLHMGTPIMKLNQKGTPFVWSDGCEKVFGESKNRLTSTLMLIVSEKSMRYQVYCDTSRVGLGCVLMQKDRVVEYGARLLKTHKKNYLVHEFKLVVIVFTLKQWRYYLYREKFEVFLNHKSFKYLFTLGELNL